MKFMKKVLVTTLVAALSLGALTTMPLAAAGRRIVVPPMPDEPAASTVEESRRVVVPPTSETTAVPLAATRRATVAPAPESTALTVEEAARRAIRNNSAIANMQDSESVADERVGRALNAVHDAATDAALTNARVSLMDAELSRAVNIRDIQAQKDNVEYQITRSFNNILNMQADLELAAAQLEMANRELAISRLMLSLGMVSELDYEAATLAVTRIENNMELLRSSINAAFRNLNSSMGNNNLQDLDRHHELKLELVYTPVEVANLNNHAQRFVNESLAVARAENRAHSARYRVTYHATPHDPTTGRIIDAPTYDEQIVAYNQELRNVADTRQSVREGVITSYNRLRDIELNIRIAEIELERLARQLEVAEATLALGRNTQIEVDRIRLDIASRENTLRQTKNNHAIQLMAFNNPNILS